MMVSSPQLIPMSAASCTSGPSATPVDAAFICLVYLEELHCQARCLFKPSNICRIFAKQRVEKLYTQVHIRREGLEVAFRRAKSGISKISFTKSERAERADSICAIR